VRKAFLVMLAVTLVVVVCDFTVPPAKAQGSTPQAYSITEDPGFSILGPSVVKVMRDGSKEVVDQIMPAGAGRPKEYHGHLVYDFQAHTLYTTVLSDSGIPCGAQVYQDASAPKEFDVISGGAELMKEMSSPDDKSTPIGNEVLNGIPSRVVKITSSEANAKVWYAQNGGYPVKIVILDKDGKETSYLEVKQLSFAKPPASAFALPPTCAGVQPPVSTKPSTNVTGLTLEKIGNYTGPCPARLKLVGTITTDGPGTVFYQFGAGNMEPGETIVFSAAGTKNVTHTITLQPKYGNQMGGSAILEAIGATPQGNHGIPTQGSNNSDFSITCTSGGGK
jgi:hypothetical protein